jgi:hypothetical protein
MEKKDTISPARHSPANELMTTSSMGMKKKSGENIRVIAFPARHSIHSKRNVTI